MINRIKAFRNLNQCNRKFALAIKDKGGRTCRVVGGLPIFAGVFIGDSKHQTPLTSFKSGDFYLHDEFFTIFKSISCH